MSSDNKFSPFKNFKDDIPASIVVFLVAVPLCLGIALASGAPLFSGLIAGMIGGIVVGALSGSSLGVSGPAAGLAVIVLNAIQDLGAFEIFLVAVVLAGIIQFILGLVRGGIIAYYFPSSVIVGMLAGIGAIIFLKQITLAFGIADAESGAVFDEHGIIGGIPYLAELIRPAGLIITAVSLGILLLWETKFIKNIKGMKIVPGPLVAVIVGSLLAYYFGMKGGLKLPNELMVQIPESESIDGFFNNFTFPDWSALANTEIYVTAVIIAVVASLETLLCVEATDKIDPHNRVTPTNRELRAQGIGNVVSGLIGGLPITQVIVRSSANIQTGGKTKAAAVIHGFLILGSIIAIPHLLNMIPLATLAAILMVVGFKLARPSVWKKQFANGMRAFVPFVVTVLGIVFTDLLTGLAIGLVVAVIFLLYNNYRVAYALNKQDNGSGKEFKIKLAQEVTFLNKATILKTLDEIPNDSKVELDMSETQYIDQDVLEVIENFKKSATNRNITLTLVDLYKEREKQAPDHITVTVNDQNQKIQKEVIEPGDN
ncbi:SulP family inorganic anion transporter [Halocola ammonii]